MLLYVRDQLQRARLRDADRDVLRADDPRNDLGAVWPIRGRLLETGALKVKREYLLERGMAPDQISVLNTGRKRRK